jgi:hypothetical protein
MRLPRFEVGLCIAVLFVTPGFAGSVQVYTGVVAGNDVCSSDGATPSAITSFFGNDTIGFGLSLTGNGISSCGLSGQINNLTQVAGPLNTAYNLNNVDLLSGAIFNGSASATANYGLMSVGATSSLTGVAGYLGEAESVAFALANDTISLPGSGSGFMAFGFTYGGSLTVGNPANGGAGQAQVEVQIGNTSQEIFYANLSGTSVSAAGEEPIGGGEYAPGQPVPGCTTGSGTFTCTNATLTTSILPITFGTPLTFDFGLLTAVQAGDDQTITSDPPDISLTSIQVYNASGQLMQNFTIQSGSGAVYGADGIESEPTSAPEPATFLLAGCALLALGGKWWRKRA